MASPFVPRAQIEKKNRKRVSHSSPLNNVSYSNENKIENTSLFCYLVSQAGSYSIALFSNNISNDLHLSNYHSQQYQSNASPNTKILCKQFIDVDLTHSHTMTPFDASGKQFF